jgi:hypothetical protein
MVTIALRGENATKMRSLAEAHGMSLAKLLRDMMLVYEGEVNAGYEPGTCLASRQIGESE